MDIIFKDSEGFTLGVELELQLVDKESLSLVETSDAIIESIGGLDGRVKHELLKSNIEVVSGVCKDVREVEEDLGARLKSLIRTAGLHDTLLLSAGTHPFSKWRDQSITGKPRYQRIFENLRMVARRFNIFGLHVHVGVSGGERCVYVMNRMLYFLPHLLALSANSPLWEGEETGLKSYRTKVFETLPVAGLPFYFHDWSDYTRLVENYLATGSIMTIRELWWDVRPHPDFGTIELRICDAPATLSETTSIVALTQALVKKFSDEFDSGKAFTRPHSSITRENKWRACRYGLEGRLIGEDGSSTVATAEALRALVGSVEGAARELGSLEYLAGVEEMIRRGTGASRQIEVFRETADPRAVAAYLHRVFSASVGAAQDAGTEAQ